MNPGRVLVAGDVHGNLNWIRRLVKVARSQNCPVILQLGDFGAIWHRQTEKNLRNMEYSLSHHDVSLWAIGGNHEDYDGVRRFEERRDADGLVRLSPHVRWIPRGARWEWNGVAFGALGGAFSIDYLYRTAWLDWWPEDEQLKQQDVERLGSAPLDVLVTHEAPAAVRLDVGIQLSPKDEREASKTRELIDLAIQSTSPRLVLHGNWHHRHSSEILLANSARGSETTVRVEGFASDVEHDGRAWGVLELPNLVLTGGDEL